MIVFLFIAVAFMSRVADENIQMKKQKDTIRKGCSNLRRY